MMALKKKPVNGMRDILPEEMQVRDYVQSVIKETFRSFGFTPIETPCMEDISNLSNKQGGENEKLIFKVLKRGEKLKIDQVNQENDLVDMGLRYDLTVPLARFYSNHENELPVPFKAIQIGQVWRADRPQRGRYRQFVQCDIDVIGDGTNLAEIELILATSTTLEKLGFNGFAIRINERRILKAMAAYSGFAENEFEEVFIILDKMDKIGLEGVEKELVELGYDTQAVEKYLDLFHELENTDNSLDYLEKHLQGFIEEDVINGLREIKTAVDTAKTADFQLKFDPTLVRGMSYYTGTIFEVTLPNFGGSCGGGGRYDKMIGSFTGKDVPACGFSIGFERIILLLMEAEFQLPRQEKKIAFLMDKNLLTIDFLEVLAQAKILRAQGNYVLISRMNKNKKFQKEQLEKEGYHEIKEVYSK
jgi:histidyl-tRNA synthetase